MKKFFFTFLLAILLFIVYLYNDDILRVYNKYIINHGQTNYDEVDVTIGDKNKYYRNLDFNFVQNTDNFKPHSRQDLYNIYYTVINSGKEKFTFYCPSDYAECIDEVKYLSNDRANLSNINNFVHPYNTFKNLETTYDSKGKVTLKIYHNYSSEDIDIVDKKIKEIETNLKNGSLSTEEQIKTYHDYIIDNAVYDSDRSDRNIVRYKSDTAYGTLIEGYSLCGGYTDTMAIILNDMGIVNYRVSSHNHIWNAVKINDSWLNLDLTWDDPVTQNGINLIEHDFFLITTEKLKQIEQTEHQFEENVYSELVR